MNPVRGSRCSQCRICGSNPREAFKSSRFDMATLMSTFLSDHFC